ncbi:MAG: hypothetical protein JXM73_03885 [Anaerolineae bacterium]|nr:hypothetical protein [Anaerolineae bacterium]
MVTPRSVFSTLTFRRPAPGDAPRVLELMIRRDVEEVGHPDSILEDLQYDWLLSSQRG